MVWSLSSILEEVNNERAKEHGVLLTLTITGDPSMKPITFIDRVPKLFHFVVLIS
jgi:hypothetical protein